MDQQQQPQQGQQTPNVESRSKQSEQEFKFAGTGQKAGSQGDAAKTALDSKGNIVTSKNSQTKGKWRKRNANQKFWSSGWTKNACEKIVVF